MKIFFSYTPQRLIVLSVILFTLAACSGLNSLTTKIDTKHSTSHFRTIQSSLINDYLERLWLKLNSASQEINEDFTPPNLFITVSPLCLAIIDSPSQLVISNSFIDKLENEGELFFVISHETAHAMLNHKLQLKDSAQNKQQELDADRYATALLIRAGYNPWLAIDALVKAYSCNLWADSSYYPSLQERIDLITKYISYLSGNFSIELENREFNKFKKELSAQIY